MQSFDALFGRPAEVHADAPGRVNLIGEHTDYNGGFVLPVAIPQRTRVEISARSDRRVRLWSAQYLDAAAVEFTLGEETRTGDWSDYVKGMTRVLAESGRLEGFDARIESDVPVGSGLSSSAALEIAIGRALRSLCQLSIDDVALARAGQRAENEFVGAPVGVMDQMACSLADTDAALFLDTRSMHYARVPLPSSGALIVIDSGVEHRHAEGNYAIRRRECQEAARLLGVPELRDISTDALPQIEALPYPLSGRAKHVVTENARVLATVDAFRADDLTRVGDLFKESHASQRDDFAVSVPRIDALVETANNVRGVYGARMTGGGFGGSVVVLATRALAHHAAAEIARGYAAQGHRSARVLVPVAR